MSEGEATVFVCHNVDTEGPLYESLDATFERLNQILNLDLDPTRENLKLLRDGLIDTNISTSQIENLIGKDRIPSNIHWGDILNQLDILSNTNFRKKYTDSCNEPYRFNWFIMDNIGYAGENPRRRSLGHHVIYDQYKSKLNQSDWNDGIYWHYHPIAPIVDAHRSGTTYINDPGLWESLARKIIDRNYFPSAFRPGFVTERPDSHWFLEQWIPFDFGNDCGKYDREYSDNKGRFGSWENAPDSWIPYNPSYRDYTKIGDCSRYISKCLPINARAYSLSKDDVIQAFQEAKTHGSSLLAYYDHDFRNIANNVDRVYRLITEVESMFPNVKFKFCSSVEAMRKTLHISASHPKISLDIQQIENGDKKILVVTCENDIFGSQPYLSLKTFGGQYYWQNFDFQDGYWSYTFDFHTIKYDAIEKIGIAANSNGGGTSIIVYDTNSKAYEFTTLN